MQWPIEDMCRVLEVSRSGFYEWRKRPVSARMVEQVQTIAPAVRKAFADSRETYGCARISAILDRAGIHISRKRASRIMRAERLVPKAARRFKRTTNTNRTHSSAPDLLKRDFNTDRPNRVWVSDFTAIWTLEGWLYLVVFLDLFARRIVGWAAGEKMDEALLVRAFNDALAKRHPPPGMVAHSDKGGQYFGAFFRSLLSMLHIRQSMGSTADCFDNAVGESFWHTLKIECFDDKTPSTRQEAITAIFDYIEAFYNTTRIHSTLGYKSPAEFESEPEK
jgi:transposase InsO family protein